MAVATIVGAVLGVPGLFSRVAAIPAPPVKLANFQDPVAAFEVKNDGNFDLRSVRISCTFRVSYPEAKDSSGVPYSIAVAGSTGKPESCGFADRAG